MKLLTAAVMCLTVTAASAQVPQPLDPLVEQSLSVDIPTVMTQYDKTTGEIAGTTTIVGGRAYLRDRHGEHFATMIIDPDGTRRMVDVNGNPIDPDYIKQHLQQ